MQKRALKYSANFFSYHVWKGENLEENLDLFKQLFLNKPMIEDKYYKNCYSSKVSHIRLNYAVLFFCSIFWVIHRELFYLDIKVTISEISTEIIRKFVFLTMFERGTFFCASHNFSPLSFVQIIIIPACCLLCVL